MTVTALVLHEQGRLATVAHVPLVYSSSILSARFALQDMKATLPLDTAL